MTSSLQVWAVDTVASRGALLAEESRHPRLPDEERANAWPPGAERTAAHIALRILLERATGQDLRRMAFELARSGKPSIRGSRLAFSLSHCDGLALIAIDAEGPVGVDVERAGRRLGALSGRRARIEAMATVLAGGRALPREGDAATMQAWVRLEAFAKADGAGIAVLLSKLGVIGKRLTDVEAAAHANLLVPQDSAVAIDDLDVGPGFVASLARPSGRVTPPVRRFPDDARELDALLQAGGG